MAESSSVFGQFFQIFNQIDLSHRANDDPRAKECRDPVYPGCRLAIDGLVQGMVVPRGSQLGVISRIGSLCRNFGKSEGSAAEAAADRAQRGLQAGRRKSWRDRLEKNRSRDQSEDRSRERQSR